MIFIEILQLNCYAVPELPPSRNPLHNCTLINAEENELNQRKHEPNNVQPNDENVCRNENIYATAVVEYVISIWWARE